MEQITQAFYKLIKLSVGARSYGDFPKLDETEWSSIFSMARSQALIGVLSKSVEKLPNDKRPPRHILFKWLLCADNIKKSHSIINRTIPQVESVLNSDEHRTCILKGQGIAQLYPNPNLRAPGDIDVWVSGNRREVITLVKSMTNMSKSVYHHIDGLNIDGVEIETHFTPSYMANPFANRRLQKWIKESSAEQFKHCVILDDGTQMHSPTLAFNRVFILHHIYRHFFYEGIGLRQMMDFYYVLKQGFSQDEQNKTLQIYKKLNLLNFAGAAIYVLREIFGLEEQYHITAANEEYGKVLLSEIMTGGNFGQAINIDKRKETTLQRGWRIIKRSFRFIKYEPSEVFWLPYFKVMNNILYVRNYSSD